jgi:hypothetical protein
VAILPSVKYLGLKGLQSIEKLNIASYLKGDKELISIDLHPGANRNLSILCVPLIILVSTIFEDQIKIIYLFVHS